MEEIWKDRVPASFQPAVRMRANRSAKSQSSRAMVPGTNREKSHDPQDLPRPRRFPDDRQRLQRNNGDPRFERRSSGRLKRLANTPQPARPPAARAAPPSGSGPFVVFDWKEILNPLPPDVAELRLRRHRASLDKAVSQRRRRLYGAPAFQAWGQPRMQCELRSIRIETRRLALRPPASDDFEALLEIFGQPAMFRYSERGAMGAEDAWGLLLRHAGQWLLSGYGAFAVEEKATGQLVGLAGLSDFRRQLGPAFDGAPEITWSVATRAQGQGYATEAAAAALDWQQANFGAQRTVCLIHRDNAASLRVADKLGYAPFRTCDYKGYPAILLERCAPADGAERS